MSVVLRAQSTGNEVEVDISGTLRKKEYLAWVREVETLIRERGRLGLLCRPIVFHGWTVGGLWEDVVFDFRHASDIERLAIVGDKQWESAMATFCKPFASAEIRCFDVAEAEEGPERCREFTCKGRPDEESSPFGRWEWRGSGPVNEICSVRNDHGAAFASDRPSPRQAAQDS